MTHLIYDYKTIGKNFGWSDKEAFLKYHQTIRVLKLAGISKENDYTKPYLECDDENLILKIRRMTHLSEKETKEIQDACEHIVNQKVEGMRIIIDEPCNKCGKRPRDDFDGLCMDCADSLGVSDLFSRDPIYPDNLKKAEFYLNSFRNKIGSASFVVNR